MTFTQQPSDASSQELTPEDIQRIQQEASRPPNLQPPREPEKKQINIPDKFKKGTLEETLQALSEGYINLEREFHKKTQVKTPEQSSEKLPDELKIPELPKKNFDVVWDKLRDEVSTTGELSDVTREDLKSLGIPERIIDDQLKLFKAYAKSTTQAAAELVGGAQNLQALLQKASTSLSADERKVLNEQLSKPGWETVLLGLQARFASASHSQESVQDQGRMLAPTAATGDNQSTQPYTSDAEIRKDFADPRYKRDPLFREMVQKRMAKSLQQ